MGPFRSALYSSLMVTISLALTQSLFAQGQPHPQSTQAGSPSARPAHLVAIIGQVNHPGVYRAPFANPYLVDLLQNAGGFTKQANGFLRVVRRTPAGVETLYAAGRDFQLRTGDVVVANGKPQPVISPLPVQQTGGASGAAESAEEYIQLAFVNLTDWPVLVKMKPEKATIANILHELNQPADLAGSIQVLAPVETGSPASTGARLASETVLIFDRAAIRADRLPELPLALANAPQANNNAATPTIPVAAAQASGIVQRPPLSIDPLPAEVGVPAESTGPAVPLPPRFDLDPNDLPLEQTATSPFGEKYAKADVPAPPAADIDTQQTETAPIELAEIDPSSDPLAAPAPAPADPVENPWVSVLMYSLLTLLAGVGAMWAYSKQIPKQLLVRLNAWIDGAARAVPASGDLAAPLAPVNLDEMIYDRLPLVEEPIAPAKPDIAAAPESGPDRVDAAHAVPRPHFLPDTKAPREPAAVPAAAQAAEISDAAGGKRFRFDTRHDPPRQKPPMQEPPLQEPSRHDPPTASLSVPVPHEARRSEPVGGGLLDRVLSRVQGAGH